MNHKEGHGSRDTFRHPRPSCRIHTPMPASRPRTSLSHVQSQAVAWLRFPLAAAVVFIHAYGCCPALPRSAGTEALRLLRELLSHVLPSMAVPAFFLLSGYLFFRTLPRRSPTPADYGRKWRSRLHTLLLPYLLWNALALVTYWAIRHLPALLHGGAFTTLPQYFSHRGGWSIFWCSHPISHDGVSWLGLPTYALTAPIDVPLWFVRDLMVLTLLAPVLHWLLRRLHWALPALLAVLHLLDIWPPLTGCSSLSALFFTTGAALAIGRHNLVATLHPVRHLCLWAAPAAALLLLLLPAVHPLLRHVLSLIFNAAAFGAAIHIAARCSARRRTRIPRALSSATFLIYAAHTLLLAPIDRHLRTLLPATPAAGLLRYLLAPLLTIALCVVLNAALRTALPRLHGILTGQRR